MIALFITTVLFIVLFQAILTFLPHYLENLAQVLLWFSPEQPSNMQAQPPFLGSVGHFYSHTFSPHCATRCHSPWFAQQPTSHSWSRSETNSIHSAMPGIRRGSAPGAFMLGGVDSTSHKYYIPRSRVCKREVTANPENYSIPI